MRRILLIIPAAAILFASCGAGGGSANRGPSKAYKDHKAWRVSLTDSVDSLRNLYDQNIDKIDELHSEFELAAIQFDVVSDPILVEKYRVLKGWKGYDPYAGTGVVARLLEDNTIELVVSCASGKFSSVTFESGAESVSSENVPEGNALNTTMGGVCRVAFNNASSLAEFVYTHKEDNVLLRFSNGKSISLSPKQKAMIAATWHLLYTHRMLNELEARQVVVYNKLNLFESEVAKDTAAMSESSKEL